ncbi:hypothetical protein SAMD00019534_059110 [Acytostelium subglobosum LB1]|uniref:hypothetical protein n=1 Tax=Acytostelium subglobosum LB1 TaxID=1410327 RepID=UPI000645166D|nr:hypothetical protein SAMD00019534_059110 [Acytostelium subglobosum LB1]GAM22736.1 hypothetical protein SAMD00019534_059110 [Acytostelium subglobosum LB1]|eukprot:XP_012753963.1 hypothetical protein SAMD00019534_059110 [Acytostelium subglobosum LB1]
MYVNGQGSYNIDTAFRSGLRYYKLDNLVFKGSSRGQPLPFDKTRVYYSILTFNTGVVQYFDEVGRLMSINDRFGNHVEFYFDVVANVFNSRLTKIVDSFGQETIFTYDVTKSVYIAYPQGGVLGSINVEFQVNPDTQQLDTYIDPMGLKTGFTNKGGNIRTNLISIITKPNQVNVVVKYRSIKYYGDSSKVKLSFLDAVESLQVIDADGGSRSTWYNFDPEGAGHNFTGFPYFYLTGSNGDPLLTSSTSNTYFYSTVVDDGYLLTEHVYNNLHLEIETNISTKDTLKLLSKTTYKFNGQKPDGSFPLYDKLPSNYQVPTIAVNEVVDAPFVRAHKSETDTDVYGNTIAVRTYDTDLDTGVFILVSEVKTTYFNMTTMYGQVSQKDSIDYWGGNGNPEFRRTVNTLTDDNKNIATSTDGQVKEGVFLPFKKTSYAYDTKGRVLQTKTEWADGNDHKLQSTFTNTKYLLEGKVLTVVTINAELRESKELFDTCSGLVTSTVDALGNITSNTYDNNGRIRSTTDPLGAVTRCIYDDFNNIVTKVAANGYTLYTTSNGFGEQVRTADNLGPNGTERVLSKKSYNSQGQVMWEEGIIEKASRTEYTYNDRGQVSTVRDALDNVIETIYNPIDQTKIQTFNGVATTSSTSTDREVKVVVYSSNSEDTLNSRFTFNASKDIVSSTIGTGSSPLLSTYFKYGVDFAMMNENRSGPHEHSVSTSQRDLFGNIIQQSVSTGSQQCSGDLFEFNRLNQLLSDTNPLGQSIKYTYNSVGQPLTLQTYDGTVFNSTYNANKMLTSYSYIDAALNLFEKRMTYYPLSYKLQKVETFLNGISQGAISYTYLLDGSLESITYPDGNFISYTYDLSLSQLTQFRDAMGQVTIYTYDVFGRLVSAQVQGSTTQLVTLSYFSKDDSPVHSGKLKALSIGNGQEHQYLYDGFGSLEEHSIYDTTPDRTSMVSSQRNTYDVVTRNIVSTEFISLAYPNDESMNYTVSYVYDDLNRMLKATKVYLSGVQTVSSYKYDSANNVIAETIEGPTITETNYTYDLDNKLIQTMDVQSGVTKNLTYDTNGNLTDDGRGSTFTYNLNNQLVSYQFQGMPPVTYTYYADGSRASKSTGGRTIRYYYDGAALPNLVNEVLDSQYTTYLMNGSSRYSRIVHNPEDLQSSAQFLISNNKDIVIVLDESNLLEASYQFDPYGAEQLDQLAFTLTLADNPFRYTGEYTDMESGLIYLRSRYYNPSIKRFMTRDSATTFNRYGYGDGNPIMNSDPSGMVSWQAILGIVYGSIAVVGSIALTVVTAGASTPLAFVAITQLMLAAGSSSVVYSSTHINDWSLKDWAMEVGINAGAGLLSAGAGAFTGNLISKAVASATGSGFKLAIARAAVAVIGAALIDGATNMAITEFQDRNASSVDLGISGATGFGMALIPGLIGIRAGIARGLRAARNIAFTLEPNAINNLRELQSGPGLTGVLRIGENNNQLYIQNMAATVYPEELGTIHTKVAHDIIPNIDGTDVFPWARGFAVNKVGDNIEFRFRSISLNAMAQEPYQFVGTSTINNNTTPTQYLSGEASKQILLSVRYQANIKNISVHLHDTQQSNSITHLGRMIRFFS